MRSVPYDEEIQQVCDVHVIDLKSTTYKQLQYIATPKNLGKKGQPKNVYKSPEPRYFLT